MESDRLATTFRREPRPLDRPGPRIEPSWAAQEGAPRRELGGSGALAEQQVEWTLFEVFE